MRCYLCNGDVDVAMMSGVPVCLHCRRRDQVCADMTTPEQRAENEAFMRLFGEPHRMATMPPLDRDWARAWFGGRELPGKVFEGVPHAGRSFAAKVECEARCGVDFAHGPDATVVAVVDAANPKRLHITLPTPDYEAAAAVAEVYAWAALTGIERRPGETLNELQDRVLAKLSEPMRSPWGAARFGTQKDEP